MTEYLPSWQDDSSASECFLCESSFTFFNRRHHCRKCGKVVCGQCSSQVVKYFPNTMIIESSGRTRRSSSLEYYRTCDVCAEEIKMIRRALFLDDPTDDETPASTSQAPTTNTAPSIGESDTNSVTKYSTRTSTRRLDSSTNSSVNTSRDDLSDQNLCPVCATNLLDEYIKTHKRHIAEISNEDFEGFKEDHIKGCLTAFDFDVGHSRYNGTGTTRKHPRNKMLVYNIPPIPQPKYESIGPVTSETEGTSGEGTSYDTVKQLHQPGSSEEATTDSFRIGSVTSSSTFHQEKTDYMEDENECVICLEELKPGDKVGRLECLCVFHYKCIKDWFNKKGYGECPVHYLSQ